MPYYVGIANTCHDAAVAVLSPDGKILFAEAMERCFQKKRAWDLPPDHGGWIREVIETYCDPNDDFIIATPWKTRGLLGWQKEGETDASASKHARSDAPSPGSLFRRSDGQWLAWSQKQCFDGFGEHLKYLFRHYFKNESITFRQYDHHLAHAAMACYTAPFERALCLIADGEGEIGAVSSFAYEDGKLKRLQRSWGPGSLGSFYAKISELCGFDWRKGEEGKTMGLAAYGAPQEALFQHFSKLIRAEGCRLFFPNEPELGVLLSQLETELKKASATDPHLHENIANNGQRVFEQSMSQLLNALSDRGFSSNLVLGGGCALNSSFNGKILNKTPFTSVHVPCAPGDDGNALGAAFLAFCEDHPRAYRSNSWGSAYLGSPMATGTLSRLKRFFSARWISHHPGTLHLEAAKLLSEGKILGWIQGRAEYGPRALGNRSILADPRGKNMKDGINARVKFREAFRPFAPAILDTAAAEWFEAPMDSPYMSFTRPWKKSMAGRVPAVVHEDGTGRLQTVTRQSNRKFYDLLTAFNEITGVPIVLNTSMNIMGRPIVHSLEDVLGIFFTTGMDAMAVGDLLIRKQ